MEELVILNLKDTYNRKRVLVTGASGFKGSWLSIWLYSLGSEVLGYSLKPKTNRDNYVICGLSDKMKHIEADIVDYENLLKIIKNFKPHFIFHLAAQPLVIESYNDPLSTYKTNVIGTLNILEAIRESGLVEVAIIVTSDKCYEINTSKISYKETDSLGGIDPYSASKAACEIITSSYIKSYFSINNKTNIASVRAGNVIGGGDWAENRIVPDCIRAIEMNQPIKLRNPGATRPWQHVLEPISGYLRLGEALHKKEKDYQSAWNFGPALGHGISVEEVAKAITRYFGKGDIFHEKTSTTIKESQFLAIDIEKSIKLLGWSPKLNFDETIRLTVEEYDISSFSKDEIFNQRINHINYYIKK